MAAEAEDPAATATLEKFRLYETRARFYVIGSSREKRSFRVLKIDRSEPSELHLSEDPVWYSQQEVKSLLQRIAEGNRSTGGLTFVTKAYGIAGCIKFLESYYLILVTKRRQVGCICGHAIYCIDESQMITIPHSTVQTDVANSKNELRYKKLLESVDLAKDFFYSYTYPIMQSLQQNVTSAGMKEMPYENLFVWNSFLTEPIRSRCNNALWNVALVHGHFKQVKLSIFGRDLNVILISRRSRHFAGTRYLKRGVNDHGKVANDVETEQIVFEEEAGSWKGRMSAVVQMRGSIPLFWSQEAGRLSPKPDIFVQRYDPTYEATKLHFEDLAQRYGQPIIILNLIKTVEKRPREMMLRREFSKAVEYLNQNVPEERKLRFIHWDFHKFAKSKSANVLGVLGGVASEALDLTGFYYSGKPKVQKRRSIRRTSTARDGSIDIRASSGDLPRLSSSADALGSTGSQDMRKNDSKQEPLGDAPCYQTGVLRTNCIDCLDRTNVAQYAYGLAALGRQLHAMGLTDVSKIHPDSSIASALMEMYQSMGDALAHQYGGSAAHNTVFPERQGKWKATTQSREFLKSIKRYYSNAYTDGEKQDAINLFLGYFQPQEGKPALWELDTDYYLHVTTAGDDSYHLSSAPGNNVSGGSGDAMSPRSTLSPVPACKDDFSRMKLTSFDKLIERTCSSLRDVRLHRDADLKPSGGVGTSGMAPDAAEIQLKTPNWLFGQRKHAEPAPTTKVIPVENVNDGNKDDTHASICGELNWLSSSADLCEEDNFRRYLAFTTADAENGWYSGTLLYDQDENSGAYKHYSELCQGPVMDPFEHDPEKERHYAEALSVDIAITDDAQVEAEMKAALDDYQIVGSDLCIIPSCGALAEDPSQLTRWIIGDEKLRVVSAVQ
ncbi:phosphatidylinositol-3-phosphatase SAC1-like [Lolium rigidum]|uniref:phosphatidylinositol-3-phosphatase SAC1-like n=1 Tax=Lolium rigidum TaxID=89674 RepID=UPI001F5C318F|nr:phosphatidylinositol-3-phosphatase SAC1-like [Lolium rigidum]XP_047080546.1 phosphatidylinositol-3-phosphatase SAC1-like [Lolium rigidum]